MKVSIKNNAQGGFTLIELIVVIVILGILAATALPKFANLGGDARLASLQAAKGSMAATASMIHGKYLVMASQPATITVEGVTVNMQTSPAATGYPKADTNMAQAAGLSDDYTVYGPNHTADDNSQGTGADELIVIPKSVASSPTGKKCYIKYKEAAAAGSAPTITLTGSATDCE